MELQVFDCEQGTPEWLDSRIGVVTASEMHCVMAKARAGEGVSKTRSAYMRRLAAEIIAGEPCPTWEGNADTRRGTENEPIARELYQLRTGANVGQVGFLRRGRIGCSPDALVEQLDPLIVSGGGAEIKCKRPDIHVEVLLTGVVPAEHQKQIQTTLYVTGREWWDFVCFTKGLPLFIQRVHREEEMIDRIVEESEWFLEELDEMVTRLKGMF